MEKIHEITGKNKEVNLADKMSVKNNRPLS